MAKEKQNSLDRGKNQSTKKKVKQKATPKRIVFIVSFSLSRFIWLWRIECSFFLSSLCHPFPLQRLNNLIYLHLFRFRVAFSKRTTLPAVRNHFLWLNALRHWDWMYSIIESWKPKSYETFNWIAAKVQSMHTIAIYWTTKKKKSPLNLVLN